MHDQEYLISRQCVASKAPEPGCRQSIRRRRRPSNCSRCCRVPQPRQAHAKSASIKLCPSTSTRLKTPLRRSLLSVHMASKATMWGAGRRGRRSRASRATETEGVAGRSRAAPRANCSTGLPSATRAAGIGGVAGRSREALRAKRQHWPVLGTCGRVDKRDGADTTPTSATSSKPPLSGSRQRAP